MTDSQRKKGKPQQEDVVIGQNLKKLRLLKEISQQALGELVGVTFQQIQKYESGANRISASRLLDLSRVLNVDIKLFYTSLSNDDEDMHLGEFDPEVLKLLRLLQSVENKDLLKQISGIVRSIIDQAKRI